MARSAKPRIRLDDGKLHDWANRVWAELVAANDELSPQVVLHGSHLSFVADGQLRPHSLDTLRDRASEIMDFEAWRGQGNNRALVLVKPDRDIITTLLSRGADSLEDVPVVDAVVRYPVVGKHGRFVKTPGYDAEARVIYLPDAALEGITIPDDPSVDDLEEARSLIDGLLYDFVWADDASKAHAVARMVEPMIKPSLTGPTPIHISDASNPGAGKSYLDELVLIPTCGAVEPTPLSAKEEERRKLLLTAVREGALALRLDNVSGYLDSPTLAAAATATWWKDRILGSSETADGPITWSWSITANNLTVSRELADRIDRTRLDPYGQTQTEIDHFVNTGQRIEYPPDTPQRRKPKECFRHPDLRGYALAHRRELVWALGVFVQHFLNGAAHRTPGSPLFAYDDNVQTPPDGIMGSFEDWSYRVGGVVKAAGYDGFLSNQQETWGVGDEADELAGMFLETLYAVLNAAPGAKLTSEALYDALSRDTRFKPDELSGLNWSLTKLRVWLRTHNDTVINGLVLRNDGKKRGRLWWVEARTGRASQDEVRA